MKRVSYPIICVVSLVSISANGEELDPAGVEFFESKIRPVLVEHCYKCHSQDAKSVKGGLLLDTRDGIRAGGDSGEAIIPKQVDDSLLINSLNYEDYEMPPSGQLPESIIRDFERWVNMGAPDPRDQESTPVGREINIEKGRDFWAFKAPELPDVPEVDQTEWPRSDIDRFVLARIEEKGLAPVGDADRATWLRRVTFDLTGLPPTVNDIQNYLADESATAQETVVDRLLDSPQFGERWGRNWLDVVRYAESIGKTRNFPFPFAWRYRDYVIQSFNEDKPYNQFLMEQLAGDLLPFANDKQRDEYLVATGYLAIGSHDLNVRNERQYDMDVAGEQIDVVSRSLMGITLGCARCHDHKFDPIPNSDYYAMAGILSSSKILNGYDNRKRAGGYLVNENFHTLKTVEETSIELPAAVAPNGKQKRQLRNARRAVTTLRDRLAALSEDTDLPRKQRKRQMAAIQARIKQAQKKVRRLNRAANNKKSKNQGKQISGPLAMGVCEKEKIADCRINIRGDARNLGERVPRGFVQVLEFEPTEIPQGTSGRLQLAEWLVDARHPLTARVFVNRVWGHLFGQGIVRTTDNFGEMGARPTHPELLDFVAVQFVQDGWSVKQLIRQLVLTRTYQLGSAESLANQEIDGDNRFLWRMNYRRLEAEAIRDSILQVSGKLDLNPPPQSLVAKYGVRELRRAEDQSIDLLPNRSIYLPIVRNHINRFFTIFDFPDPSEVRGHRDATTVSTQALFMMNSDFIHEQATFAAENLMEQTDDVSGRIELAYRKTLGRQPTEQEVVDVVSYFGSGHANLDDETKVWTDIIHALFASAEFRYR